VAKAVGNSKPKKTSTTADKRPNDGRAKSKAKPKDAAKRGAPRRAKPAARQGEKKGLVKFLRDVRVEMSKVTWPTRKDLVQSTWVVIVAVAIAASYIFVLDQVFARALGPITP
jgi:preprotein translocase subunit SecE